MASNLLKYHAQSIQISHPLFNLKLPSSTSLYSIGVTQQLNNLCHSVSFTKPLHLKKFHVFPSQCALSSSSPNPPKTKEDAITQAKFSLSSTLEKPLNNPKLVGRLKKLKQPRFRVEIPVVDDSSSSLSQLAVDIFVDMPIKRKGPKIKILLLWPNKSVTQAAQQAFGNKSSNPIIENLDISSISSDVDTRMVISSADVIVFMDPEASRLTVMKEIVDVLYPKPVVIFNPTWGYDEERSFGELSGFVGSFEVVYSFMGLEVRGILSKRKGMIFKCVKDGVLSGEKWYVLVEEEDGELKVVSRFKTRPSIDEVENVLYNLMAINSPITRSAKFLKDLVSNVRGDKNHNSS